MGGMSALGPDFCFAWSGSLEDGFCGEVAVRDDLVFAFAWHSSHLQLPCRAPSFARALDPDLRNEGLFGLCGILWACFSAAGGLLLLAARLSRLVSRVNVADPAFEAKDEFPLFRVAAVWLEYPESLASSRPSSVTLMVEISGFDRLAATLAVWRDSGTVVCASSL